MRFTLLGCWLLSATTLIAAPKTDLYGDPLPDGAVSRIGSTRMLHDDSLTWADFSADGRRLVTGGMYGERRIHVWDTATGKRIALLPTTEENETWAVAASDDGKRAAALLSTPGKGAYRMWLTVWDVESGKKLAQVLTQERSGGSERIAFTTDGKTAAVHVGKIYLVDVDAGRVTGTVDDPDDRLLSLRFVAGGKFLFASGEKSFYVWNARSKERVAWGDLSALGDPALLTRPGMSADGRTLVIRQANEIRAARITLPAKEGERIRIDSVKKFKTTGSPIAVAADGSRFVVADERGVTQLFAFDRSESLREVPFRHPPLALRCLAETALAAERGELSYSRRIHVWDLQSGKEITAGLGLHYADGAAKWSADGAAILTDGARWDPNSGKYLGRIQPSKPAAEWKTPDGRRALVSPDGRTAVVSVVDGKQEPSPLTSSIMQLPPVRAVEVWDVNAKQVRTKFRDQVVNPPRITENIIGGNYRLSHDGRIMAAADYTELQLWDTTTGRLLRGLDLAAAKLGGATALDITADGRRILVTAANGAAVVEVAARGIAFKVVRPATRHSWRAGRFAPDGRRIALVGEASRLLVLDVVSGAVVVDQDTGQIGLAHVAFRPDGRQLLTQGSAGWCLVWDVPAPAPLKPLAENEIEEAWEKLGAKDPAAALPWVGRCSVSGEAAAEFIGKRLKSEAAVPKEELQTLVAGLAAPTFREREAARKRLQELGEPIVPALRAEIARTADAEAAERLRRIVDQPSALLPLPAAEVVRGLRALEALEHIATPLARKVIERTAAGPVGMPLADEARAVLGRMGK
jgi:WD40 repeat protein